MFLNQEHRAIIKKWFGVSRFVYNTTIKYLQQPDTKADWKKIKTGILNDLPEWCKEVPYQIKSIAIKDACLAVKKAKGDFKTTGKIYKCKFRSRKNLIQSCYIPKSAVSEKGIYHTKLGKLKFAESLPKAFGDCRLVMAYGNYYLSMPIEERQHKTDNQGRVVALDPGIRTFQTFFSETSFGEIGNGANLKVFELL
ncbi:MAG: helix-turn-helix domain-containing protein, partial [Cyanobacteria bacterium J06636_27]